MSIKKYNENFPITFVNITAVIMELVLLGLIRLFWFLPKSLLDKYQREP